MNEALREQVKARLAELRERFGEHDPDVALFTAFVAETEPAQPELPLVSPPEVP